MHPVVVQIGGVLIYKTGQNDSLQGLFSHPIGPLLSIKWLAIMIGTRTCRQPYMNCDTSLDTAG